MDISRGGKIRVRFPWWFHLPFSSIFVCFLSMPFSVCSPWRQRWLKSDEISSLHKNTRRQEKKRKGALKVFHIIMDFFLFFPSFFPLFPLSRHLSPKFSSVFSTLFSSVLSYSASIIYSSFPLPSAYFLLHFFFFSLLRTCLTLLYLQYCFFSVPSRRLEKKLSCTNASICVQLALASSLKVSSSFGSHLLIFF